MGAAADRQQNVGQSADMLHDDDAGADGPRPGRPVDDVDHPAVFRPPGTTSRDDARVSEHFTTAHEHERTRARPVWSLLPILPVKLLRIGSGTPSAEVQNLRQ